MARGGSRSVARRAAEARFVVLTGLSGAGKSQAIRALEDLGYFCVDNLPTMLIPTMAELASRAGSGLEKVAIVVDVREGAFLSQFPRVFRRIRRMPALKPVLIFLEARDAALVRRFSETRRPHPLAKDRPVLEGIREEKKAMRALRRHCVPTLSRRRRRPASSRRARSSLSFPSAGMSSTPRRANTARSPTRCRTRAVAT